VKKIFGAIGTVFGLAVLGLVLFGPPGMAADFVSWTLGRIGAFAVDLFSHIPRENA
jgi:hypothetical protein